MAYIVQTLSANRLQIGHEEMLRPLVFGSQWNAVRIAALVQVDTAASFLNSNSLPPLALGIATGASGIWNDGTTDVIAASPSINFSHNWTWGTGSGNYYVQCSSGGMTGFQKIGSAFTTATSGSSVCFMGALPNFGTPSNYRTIVAADFIKGTPQTGSATPYSVIFWAPNSAATAADASLTNFFDRVQQMNAITNCVALGTATLTPSGSMAHDYALLAWNRSSPAFDVCAWAAIRFA